MPKTLSKKKAKPVRIPNFNPKLSATKAPTEAQIQAQFEVYAHGRLAKESDNPKELKRLSESLSKSVKFWVAHNKYTSPEVLIKLSECDSYTVRAAVAQNENTPTIAILKLKNDPDKDISQIAAITHSKQVKKLIGIWLE